MLMVVNQLYASRAQPRGPSCRERGPLRKAEPAYGPFAAARQEEAEGVQRVRDWLKREVALITPPEHQLAVCLLFVEDIEPETGAVLADPPVVELFTEQEQPEIGTTFAAIGW